MTDDATLQVYSTKAKEYAALTDTSGTPDRNLQAFMDALVPGGTVLDLGCGPGTSAGLMAQAGFRVTAMDPVPEMVAMAAAQKGVHTVLGTFDDVSGTNVYDGIWANFSLLHASRDAMPLHLSALAHALRPGGVFHIGMKTGTGSARDTIGRLYTYYTDAELTGLLADVGLTVTSRRTGEDPGLDGVMAPWITMMAHA